MKFFIDDLPIYFPYEFIYPEQYAYIKDIKKTLDAKVTTVVNQLTFLGPLFACKNSNNFLILIVGRKCLQEQEKLFVFCLLLSPINSITQRSVNSFTAPEQVFYYNIYCVFIHQVPEIEKALAELQRLMDYRRECGLVESFLGIGLTSRKNLCVHDQVPIGLHLI